MQFSVNMVNVVLGSPWIWFLHLGKNPVANPRLLTTKIVNILFCYGSRF